MDYVVVLAKNYPGRESLVDLLGAENQARGGDFRFVDLSDLIGDADPSNLSNLTELVGVAASQIHSIVWIPDLRDLNDLFGQMLRQGGVQPRKIFLYTSGGQLGGHHILNVLGSYADQHVEICGEDIRPLAEQTYDSIIEK